MLLSSTWQGGWDFRLNSRIILTRCRKARCYCNPPTSLRPPIQSGKLALNTQDLLLTPCYICGSDNHSPIRPEKAQPLSEVAGTQQTTGISATWHPSVGYYNNTIGAIIKVKLYTRQYDRYFIYDVPIYKTNMNRRNNQCSQYEDKETETLHYTKIIDDQPRPSKSHVVSIRKKKHVFLFLCVSLPFGKSTTSLRSGTISDNPMYPKSLKYDMNDETSSYKFFLVLDHSKFHSGHVQPKEF